MDHGAQIHVIGAALELKRIMKASDEAGVLLRVIGSLAFQMHCPKFGYLQQAMGRAYTDIDFAGYSKQTKAVQVLMAKLGYTDNQEVFIVSLKGLDQLRDAELRKRPVR